MSPLNTAWFPQQVLPKPSGYYAHLVMLRVTDSYALFQTDGELNTARIRLGERTPDFVSRIEIFKRKQTTPERLVGRELLRHYGFLSLSLRWIAGEPPMHRTHRFVITMLLSA